MTLTLYTIGHSNHTWEAFLDLLRQHHVEVLVDVRSNPASRFARFANRRRLPQLLEQAGIRHLWMGESLGGKPADPALHDSDGAPDYEKIRMQPVFADGIEQLARRARTVSVAIMCAEEDPVKCHRTLLIAPALVDRGVSVAHIRKDGSAQQSL